MKKKWRMISNQRKLSQILFIIIIFILVNSIGLIQLTGKLEDESNASYKIDKEKLEELKASSDIGSPLLWKYQTGDQVYSVAFSGNGQYLASGGDLTYGQLFFFNTSNSMPLWNSTLGDRIRSVALSTNGRYLVAGSDTHRLYYFDTTNSTPIWSSPVGAGAVSVAISSNGRYIACEGGGSIYFFHNTSSIPYWAYSTGALVGFVDISADGRYIVGGNENSIIYLFENTSSTPLWSYSSSGSILDVSISDNGEYFVAANLGVSNYIYLFHRSSATPLWSFSLGSSNYVRRECLKISADGEYILAGTDQQMLYLFHRSSPTPIWNFTTSYHWNGVDISADGGSFVAAVSRKVFLFNRSGPFQKWAYSVGESNRHIAISRDGRLVAAGDQDEYVYLMDGLWDDKSTSSPLLWYSQTGYVVKSVAISSDGNYIISGSKSPDKNLIAFYHKDDPIPLWTSNDLNGEVFSVDISSDGSYMVAGTGYGFGKDTRVYLFEKNSSTPLWNYEADDIVFSVAISSDGNYIAAGSKDDKVYLFHKSSSSPIWSYTAGNHISSVAISSDGMYIVAGSGDHKIYFFNRSSSTPLWSHTIDYIPGNMGDVDSVSISSDGNYIAAGTQIYEGTSKVCLFHRSSSTPLWKYSAEDYINSVSIDSDGNYLVAGDQAKKIYFFNRTISTPLWNYTAEDSVNSVSISADGNYIVAGGGWNDTSIYFFSNSYNNPLWKYKTTNIINSVDISFDGSKIVGGGLDENVYLFKTNGTQKHITLYTDADNPDTNADFNLYWNTFFNPEHIWIYEHNSYITEINESVNVIDSGDTLNNPYRITGRLNGTYYYKVKINNSIYGEIYSSCIKVYINAFYNLLWAKFYGGDNTQGGMGLSIDSLGNVIQTGYIMDGPYGRNDGIILKSSNSGIQIWNKTFGGAGDDIGKDVCTDSNDNIYIIGTLGDYPIAGQEKIIVLKYNSSGHLHWNRTWSGMSSANGRSIAIDSEDNIYIAGFAGDFPNDFVLIKYSISGVKIWQRIWGGSGDEGRYGVDIAIDLYDNIYIAGYTTSFGAGSSDAVLIKYDKHGNQKWNKTWGGGSIDGAEAIITDSKNNIFIAGYTDSFSTNDYRNLFIAKYNHSGTLIWNKTWIGIGGVSCKDMIVDSKDNIILTGNTYDSMTGFVFLLMYDREGNVLWNTTWGDKWAMISEGFGVAVDFFDNIFISGYTDYYDGYRDDIVLLKYSKLLIPDPLALYSDAGDPDIDGIFNLFWFKSDKADNYSIYVYDKYITEINISLTLLSDQIAISPYEINATQGMYYYIVVAHNIYGSVMSNCIEVLVKSQPGSFFLNSDAGNPDVDGIFNLIWTSSSGADNYSLYAYDKYITEINNSLILLSDQTAISPYEINTTIGIYYYIVVAHNIFGITLSNCIKIIVQSDNEAPIIIINLPTQNDIFEFDAPSYNISILEGNLDSVWYRLNNGTIITESIIIHLSYGDVEKYIWDQIGNGTLNIEFFANDTSGNLGYAEIHFRKDILAPSILINTPTLNDLFGFDAPSYNISILEGNLDKLWYRLNSDTVTTDTITINILYGFVSQNLWEQIGNGTLIIQIFANDTLGNLGYADVLIRKDIIVPEIFILEPSMNDVFEFAPAYEITVVDGNLDNIWYTLDEGENNYTVSELIGIINQEYWNSFPNGYITIKFYANDSLGNINYDEVIVIKTTPSDEPRILGYNLYILICIICVISVISLKLRFRKILK